MRRFFTADLHIGHKSILKFTNRPFTSVEEMDERIFNQIKALQQGDELYILGDESFNPKTSMAIPRATKARVHLIVGNHTHCFGFHLKASRMKRRDEFLRAGYASVLAENIIQLQGYGGNVKLCHFPFDFESKCDSKFKRFCPDPNDGLFLLCGHQHNRFLKKGCCIDVGYDGKLDFWTEREIVELIKDPVQYIPSRLTSWYEEKRGVKDETFGDDNEKV